MAATADHNNLRPDPCPTCGKDVANISAHQDELRSLFDDQRVSAPAEITLVPCGHEVNSYTVDTVRQTVTWNTL